MYFRMNYSRDFVGYEDLKIYPIVLYNTSFGWSIVMKFYLLLQTYYIKLNNRVLLGTYLYESNDLFIRIKKSIPNRWSNSAINIEKVE